VIRARHNGPELLATMSSLTHGAPRLTGVPHALHQAARGEHTSLDAIIAGEKDQQDTSAEVFSQGLFATTVCADFAWPWGDADAPISGRLAAATKAVTALPDAVIFPFDPAAGRRP
jgi:hypothetical protein